MSELELRLVALGGEIAYPPTPDLAAAAERAAARPRRGWRPLAVALAVVVAATAGVLAFSPGARSAFLELFRLRGATIERTGEGPRFDGLTNRQLGVPVSLLEARARSLLPLLEPRGYGEITYDARIPAVTFGWSERRLLLTELRGEALPLIQKSAGSGTTISYTEVNGNPGYWIAGARHVVALRDSHGRFLESRAAGNVLLWEQGGLVLRLEGAPTRADALAVAGTVGR